MNVKTLKDIDYSPLHDMDTAWNSVMRDMFKLPPMLVVGASIALAAVLTYVLGYGILVFLGLLASIVGQKVRARKVSIWKSFAEANGWYVIPEAAADIRFIPPGIYGIGQRQTVSPVVHAQFEGHECDLFSYEFTEGSGKNKESYFYTVARVILERPFPHLILDSKNTWAIRNRGDATERVGLEGNFDQYFSLYHKPNEHIDALSVITPDVMQTLINSNQDQDIEVSGQSLFFMVGQDQRSARALPQLLASVDALADEIAHKAQTIQYGTTNDPAQALTQAVHASFASNDQAMSSIARSVMFIILLPAIFIMVVAAAMFLARL